MQEQSSRPTHRKTKMKAIMTQIQKSSRPGRSNLPPQRSAEHTVQEITFWEYNFANSV